MSAKELRGEAAAIPQTPVSEGKTTEGIRFSVPDASRFLRGAGPIESESFTVKDFDNDLPNESWSDNELIGYAQHQAEEIRALKRQVAVHVYRLGMALSMYRSRHLSHGDWDNFLKTHGLSGPTAWRAIQLYQRAKSEAEVAGLGITEAYLHFNILRNPKEHKAEGQTSQAAGDNEAEAGSLPQAPAAAKKQSDQQETEEEPSGPGDDLSVPEDSDEEPQEESEQDDEAPKVESEQDAPPKEPETPASVLMAVKNGLEWVEEQVPSIDWEIESKDTILHSVQEVIKVAQRLEKAVQ